MKDDKSTMLLVEKIKASGDMASLEELGLMYKDVIRQVAASLVTDYKEAVNVAIALTTALYAFESVIKSFQGTTTEELGAAVRDTTPVIAQEMTGQIKEYKEKYTVDELLCMAESDDPVAAIIIAHQDKDVQVPDLSYQGSDRSEELRTRNRLLVRQPKKIFPPQPKNNNRAMVIRLKPIFG